MIERIGNDPSNFWTYDDETGLVDLSRGAGRGKRLTVETTTGPIQLNPDTSVAPWSARSERWLMVLDIADNDSLFLVAIHLMKELHWGGSCENMNSIHIASSSISKDEQLQFRPTAYG
jgi:hypothetical protein